MMRAARSVGGESWKRSVCWAEQTAGKTKRSAKKVSESRNRDRQFSVCMITNASGVQCGRFLNVFRRQVHGISY